MAEIVCQFLHTDPYPDPYPAQKSAKDAKGWKQAECSQLSIDYHWAFPAWLISATSLEAARERLGKNGLKCKRHMKRAILVFVLSVIIGAALFLAGGWVFTKRLLDGYNGMASGNFSIALETFRDDYQTKRIRIFGEVEEKSTFVVDNYEFVVIPTVPNRSGDSFNPEHTNIAAHMNGMVVMLASTWVSSGDPRGEKLLVKLKQILPNYKLSSPNIKTVALRDLVAGSEMLKAEADQWSWRMGDLPVTPMSQIGDADQPALRSE